MHDVVSLFTKRDHKRKIFERPSHTSPPTPSDAMTATDPHKYENFRWHNMGLTNTLSNADEYPVEYLCREVLSKEQLLEALSLRLQ